MRRRFEAIVLAFCLTLGITEFGATELAAQGRDRGPDGPRIEARRERPDSVRRRFAPDRFIVTLADNADPDAVAQDHGVPADFKFRRRLKGFAGRIPPAMRAALLRDPRVLRVEQDAIVTTSQYLDWGLDRIDQRTATLNGVYTTRYTGQGVTVYIVDSGILYTHQEFGGRARFGYDAFGGNGNDCNGHGTHVAGTVAGGMFGAARNASLVSVRVLDCSGNGYSSGVIAGLDWIAANAQRPAVVNMSLGGPPVAALDDAIQRLITSGITVVVAAGNEGDNACNYSPARVPAAITVGSTGQTDQRSSFSNYGSCIDLFAPGESIVSAWYTSTNAAAYSNGTSMAAPHVAGAAALLLQHYPSITPQGVRDSLARYSTKSIVGNSLSTNAHLLYTLEEPHGVTTPTPPANTPPVASFTPSCSGLSCQFIDQSTDPGGSIVSRLWNFGNGITATSPTYSYPTAGTYTVTLQVTDNAGATATTSRTVTATAPPPAPNSPPVAGFTMTCTALNCQFVNQSSDPDGSVVAWLWNFGNGVTSTAASPTYSYPAAGAYNVTLRVTDNAGTTATTSRTVVVSAPTPAPNTAPTANFTHNCSGLGCQFVDQSSDPDGSIASRLWNFGNGVTSTATSPSYTYPAGGTYTVTLRVTDNAGAQATATRTITVAAPAPTNTPPVASFTQSCTGLSCQFVDQSTDPGGSIMARLWNFGNGITSTATSPTYSYPTAGTYTVTLRVTDNAGATNTTSRTVTVSAPAAPTITLTVRGYLMKNRHEAELQWSGITSSYVDIYRNGALMYRVANTGTAIDRIGLSGPATYTYRVCPAGSTTCSQNITIRF